MKRLAMFLVILFLLVGCTNDNKNKGVSDSTDDGTSEVINNDTEGQTKTESSLFNESNTREIKALNGKPSSGSFIMCNVPITGLKLIHGSSDGAVKETDSGEYFVVLTAGSIEANKDNMFDAFVEQAVYDVNGECEIDGITIVKSSTVRIGDIDALYFEGFVKETREHFSAYGVEMYATGYVFLDGNYVNGIWGAVIEKDQTQDSIDWVNKAVDYMMSTVTFKRW